MLAHAFHSGDFLALAAGSEQCAREHGRAVNQNRTCAAGRIVASAFGAGELQIQAQRVQQKPIRLDCQLMGTAVDAEFEKLLFHEKQLLAVSSQLLAKSLAPTQEPISNAPNLTLKLEANS